MLYWFERFVSSGLDACYFSGMPVTCLIGFLGGLSLVAVFTFLVGFYLVVQFTLEGRNARRHSKAMRNAYRHARVKRHERY